MNKSPLESKKLKIIYKKGIFSNKTTNSNDECKLLTSEFEKLIQNDENPDINFTILYNTFLNLCVKKEYGIIDELYKIAKNKIESLLKSTELKTNLCVEKFISNIQKCERIIEKTKYSLINNISRFDKDAIPKINNFNSKTLILEFLKSSNILSSIKQYIIGKELTYSDTTTFNILHLIVK